MRNRFDKQLVQLNDYMLEMGSLIEQSIEMCVKALVSQDEAIAKQTIEADDDIDNQEKKIEDLCLQLLLQQQPVAVFPPQHIDWRRSRSQCRYIIVVGRRLP